MDILKRIKELSELPVAKIRATLTLEDFSPKDISEALKEAGLSGKKVAFAESFYSFLASGRVDTSVAKEYIEGNGEFGETSANVQRHLNHYMNIHALSVAVWDAK